VATNISIETPGPDLSVWCETVRGFTDFEVQVLQVGILFGSYLYQAGCFVNLSTPNCLLILPKIICGTIRYVVIQSREQRTGGEENKGCSRINDSWN